MANINALRNNKYIKEKDLGNGIHSFNFTNKCFYKGAFDKITVKARGLFYDMNNNKVVARSYDKFFAFGERPETEIDHYAKHAKYPLSVYTKYNGFLGILSAGNDGHFFVASKSTNQGEYAGYFKSLLEKHFDRYNVNTCSLYNFLKNENCSMVFEVIDIEHDPHIVSYDHSTIVLLDIIYNNIDKFDNFSYDDMVEVANQYSFSFKVRQGIIHNPDELYAMLDRAKIFRYGEGFVICDQNNWMVKYKIPWYKYWKRIRGIIQQLNAGNQPEDIKNMYVGGRRLGDCIYNTWLDFKNTYGRVPENVIEFRDFADVDINGYLLV